MTNRREEVAEDLRALAADLKSLLESATTDPKDRQRKERRWQVLYAVFGAVATLAARRAAAKAWAILTGEQPPTARPAQPATRPTEAATDQEKVPQEA